jgi:hypothetical protein
VTVDGIRIEVSEVLVRNASVNIVVTPSGNTASPPQLRPSLTTLAETTKLPPVEQLTVVLACAGLTLTTASVTSRLTIRVAMNLITAPFNQLIPRKKTNVLYCEYSMLLGIPAES